MIWVGLTGWGDHDSLYEKQSHKLTTYASHFPIVEVDSSFYAIPPQRNIEKWMEETPSTFTFIVKAFQGITGHLRGDIPYDSRTKMFEAFKQSIQPMKEANKLAMILLQFPPWFECNKENVTYLRYCRQQFSHWDIALEFRHRSWYNEQFMEKTIAFMEEDEWIHSICDEPQAGERSIPFVPHVTNKNKTLFRFHGRNIYGWSSPRKGENWRDVRYLYEYNNEELTDLAKKIENLSHKTKESYVLFNNNSGGHAAKNGKQFIEKLKLNYIGLAPRQLHLFD
ncbi:DUF72 domain-containing protein [Evansella cellulosilytica]|uniref:DUF72 domain-containing protein n=1 Tax=Evansella cellulosilytica (strain ATCC 21833 / DSM 2522 / FERM P-1141 / JCM 9156 / N-4) TaxID=649639 RepID=E6U2G0_EVAC2|nr:DUF72 domain-containing protein [Evansella cellulosilytica]ADU31673.1 protein of unknown function DUF72 [Evansella cellulosilytica DSM 2522]